MPCKYHTLSDNYHTWTNMAMLSMSLLGQHMLHGVKCSTLAQLTSHILSGADPDSNLDVSPRILRVVLFEN